MLGERGEKELSQQRVNERWRVALAGLVAVLAIPVLVIDSPSTAEGVVEAVAPDDTIAEAFEPAAVDEADAAEAVETEPVNSVSTVFVRPDVRRLAAAARIWGHAREEAIETGLVEAKVIDAPSDTRLELLPVIPDPAPEPDPEPVATTTTTVAPEAPADPDATPDDPAGDPDATPDDPGDDPVDEPEPPADPDEPVDPEEPTDPGPHADLPSAPAQVNGRVPPPAGGPTAAQWDRLRRCESTHNYAAISPTGLYRGAYQFSQQTWDWVAGIHYPYLVGIDPAEAPAGWQDVMAYTLYAMRGWDQWPVCGKHLLG